MDKLLEWLPGLGALIMAAIALYQAQAQKRQTEAQVDKLRADTDKSRADVQSSAVMAAAAIIDDMREEDHRKQTRILELEAEKADLAANFERTLKEKVAQNLTLESQLMQAHEYISVLESRADTINEILEAIHGGDKTNS